MTDLAAGAVVTLFRSRLRPEAALEYADMATELLELARGMPGFVSLDRFTSDDGERLSVVVFADAASEQAWRDHPRHREAQKAGRERFYSEYSIAVCDVRRAHRHVAD